MVLVKHRERVLCPASPAPLPVPLEWPATSRDHGCERLVWLVAGLAPKSYSEKYASRPPSTALPLSRQVAPRGPGWRWPFERLPAPGAFGLLPCRGGERGRRCGPQRPGVLPCLGPRGSSKASVYLSEMCWDGNPKPWTVGG